MSAQVGASEVITHGVDGFILEDPRDSRTLAELIAALYMTRTCTSEWAMLPPIRRSNIRGIRTHGSWTRCFAKRYGAGSLARSQWPRNGPRAEVLIPGNG